MQIYEMTAFILKNVKSYKYLRNIKKPSKLWIHYLAKRRDSVNIIEVQLQLSA